MELLYSSPQLQMLTPRHPGKIVRCPQLAEAGTSKNQTMRLEHDSIYQLVYDGAQPL